MHFLPCRSCCADQFQIPFSGNSKSSFVIVFFPVVGSENWAAKFSLPTTGKKPSGTQAIVIETCFRNGCSFAVMDLFYTLYLFVSVFVIILPRNFRPCPGGFSLAVVVWRRTEKYHLSLSSAWKAIPISRPTHTFFLGKLEIHCLISPILFFIAEKRNICDFLTFEKHF